MGANAEIVPKISLMGLRDVAGLRWKRELIGQHAGKSRAAALQTGVAIFLDALLHKR